MKRGATPLILSKSNCWKTGVAHRAAVLVDAADYFSALHETLLHAQRSIHILGWDLHSQVELIRGKTSSNAPSRLGPLLNWLAKRRPGLDIRLLLWDYSMVFSFQREPPPLYNLDWTPRRSIKFRFDGEHPLGGSHHQKVVVVDGKLAFAGGVDLTQRRWDTSEHAPRNNLRKAPNGESYPPFHDIQMLVDGEPAEALAELFRNRWEWASGESIRTTPWQGADIWPASVSPDFHEALTGVSRTEPQYKNRQEVREVEALYLDAIRAAKQYIYMENQYFTCPPIACALAERLREKNGPEVVVVLPRRTRGWLGEKIMDARRVPALLAMQEADAYGRLRATYPHVAGLGGQNLMVHSKTMIVDNQLLRVGSSNVNNRSMGLDTECDLAIDASGSPKTAAAIDRVRDRLMGEHLGAAPREVGATIEATNSLVQVVDRLGDDRRGLRPLELQDDPGLEPLREMEMLDPERPIEADRILDAFAPKDEHESKALKAHWFVVLAVLVILGLAAVWRWTPLSDFVNEAALLQQLRGLGATLLIYPAILGAFVLGGLVAFPVTMLIGVTALILPPVESLATALAGAMANASVTYAAGALLGRNGIRQLAGRRLNRISRRLAKRGVLSIIVVRIIPVAPFSVINVVAGASHIRFKDYFWGTFLGMAPGVCAITLFTDRLIKAITRPGVINILVLFGAIAAIAGGSFWLRRRLSRPGA
jgi:phosphatidylserine/phosphatidylglycerophosphate/cardiolipin synthase-like enzyme/uncharacterized membrane protein YdjX (TVP38/TMEM64 family)